jgi:hypothetical protein
VGDDLVGLGDGVDDLHVKVGKGVAERADPAFGLAGDRPGGDFCQRAKVAVVDDLDQSVDERAVVRERVKRVGRGQHRRLLLLRRTKARTAAKTTTPATMPNVPAPNARPPASAPPASGSKAQQTAMRIAAIPMPFSDVLT